MPAARSSSSQPAVEARLWEDPLEALRRHLAKLKDLCASATPAAPADTSLAGAPPAGAPSAEARCQDGAPETPATFKAKIPHDGLTVIAAMLPGGTFVGSAEARRRNRYAVLAGLNVAGYVPDNSERMSLLRLPRCESFSGCPDDGDKSKDQKTAGRVASAANDAPPAPDNDAAPSPSPPMDMVYETLQRGAERPRRARRAAAARRRPVDRRQPVRPPLAQPRHDPAQEPWPFRRGRAASHPRAGRYRRAGRCAATSIFRSCSRKPAQRGAEKAKAVAGRRSRQGLP